MTSSSSDQPAPPDMMNLDPSLLVGGFASHLGLDLTQVSADLVEGRWTAAGHLDDRSGVTHRGVHSSVVETLASIAAAVWLGDRGKVVGINNNTDFLEEAVDSSFVSTATPVHRGHEQQLWQVETVDGAGRTVARGQVRLQNLYQEGS